MIAPENERPSIVHYVDTIRVELQRADDAMAREMATRHALLDEEVERRITNLQRQHDADISALKDAAEAARAALEHRLDALNELRETVQDVQAKNVTSALFNVEVRALEEKIAVMGVRLESMDAAERGEVRAADKHQRRRDRKWSGWERLFIAAAGIAALAGLAELAYSLFH